MSSPRRHTLQRAVRAPAAFCFLAVSLVTTAHADPEATARLEALPCTSFDPNAYVDLWRPGQSPYGVPFASWDRSAFDTLKARLLACATPANRQRTLTVLRYLDDPYGPTSRVARQQDDQRSAASRTAALTDEIQADLAAVAGEPDLIQRRGRLMRVTTKLDTNRLPAETQLQLRAELNRQSSALAAAEEAQAQARQTAERQRRAAEAQAAADRRAAEERQQTEARAQATAVAEAATRYYQDRQARLSPDVAAFLGRNPTLQAPAARPDVLNALGILDSMGLTLDACREAFGGFRTEWTEVQRRMGLLQRLLITYYGTTPEELTQAAQALRARMREAGLLSSLKGDPRSLRQTCEGAIIVTANVFDFSG
jgi:pyruvate/2-oxoglutarate dehydrogenase complex dihydrolipoamide acyltransferase (E2) component